MSSTCPAVTSTTRAAAPASAAVAPPTWRDAAPARTAATSRPCPTTRAVGADQRWEIQRSTGICPTTTSAADTAKSTPTATSAVYRGTPARSSSSGRVR